jgi:hypothetical protein
VPFRVHRVYFAGFGLEPMTSSGLSLGVEYQLINCTSIPTALNASLRAVSTGLRRKTPGGGTTAWSVLCGSGINTPTPITWISRWLLTPVIFSGISHPASLNKGNNWFRNVRPSSPLALVYPKLIAPLGSVFSAPTKAMHCWSVSLRGLMRSLRSSKSLSAVAALACCLLISALASATPFSRSFELSTNRTISASLAWSTRLRAGPAIKPRTNSAATPSATKRAAMFCPLSIQESSVGSSIDSRYRDLSIAGLVVIWLLLVIQAHSSFDGFRPSFPIR